MTICLHDFLRRVDRTVHYGWEGTRCGLRTSRDHGHHILLTNIDNQYCASQDKVNYIDWYCSYFPTHKQAVRDKNMRMMIRLVADDKGEGCIKELRMRCCVKDSLKHKREPYKTGTQKKSTHTSGNERVYPRKQPWLYIGARKKGHQKGEEAIKLAYMTAYLKYWTRKRTC
jgi:hypothetical protein